MYTLLKVSRPKDEMIAFWHNAEFKQLNLIDIWA